MEKRKRFTAFVLPAIALLLLTLNYGRLTGTENIRAIHIVTLIGIGIALGVLLRNAFAYFKGNL